VKKFYFLLLLLVISSCSKEFTTYTLTTSVNPPDGGTISPATSQYNEGETVSLIAKPNSEYVFESWSGTKGKNIPSVTMDSDKTVTVNFLKKKYPLTINIVGEGSVKQKIIKEGSSTNYNSGSIIELTAQPSKDWMFEKWEGDLSGSENPATISIDKAKLVTAHFFNASKNEMLSFSVLKKNNPQIEKDIIFEITDNNIYQHIPNFLNAENLIATFEHNGKSIKVDSIIQKTDITKNNFNKTLFYKIESRNGDTNQYKLVLETFTKLPVALIETKFGADITSKENYVEGTLTFIGKNFEEENFTKPIKIRGRGNFTWTLPKKPYQLKFDKKRPFLDMPKDKKWIFLANYADKSMSRTALALKLGYLSNLDWTPKSDFIEVFLNGKHQGTYQVAEKVEEDDHRVNIGSDGYLLEVEQLSKIDSDDVYFITSRNILFNIKSPEISYSSDEFNYIKNQISKIENILYNPNYFDENQLDKLIDIDSFVDWFLINEIAKNNDAAFWSSCYMTLIRGEKLKMGPIWDFDIAFGNINFNDNEKAEGFWIKNSHWIKMMFRSDMFVKKVKERFLYFYSNKQDVINYSNTLSEKINLSRNQNDKVWKTLGVYIYPNFAYKFDSFSQEQKYLNDWINKRFEWLKVAIENL